ncbi:HAMP domain-containing sensor histidine kinase [Pedosphaera parvula]|uniref:histidine kinase n=1 Tax=Pedosphaera parvula (strain Ellin514) TaxID=320771 RepID=B9XIV8_PEDPL|nr:ATP-binding protein [Pedosphaera parvula]EEF60185.1 multi-sensor signal transduction histidine kinase [Pedosphaera parvula Ellin514]
MLRTRLFLSLVPFVVILLAIGIYAIVLFSRITANVDVNVTGNYRSVIAAKEMTYALDRMWDPVKNLLLDDPQANRASKGLGKSIFEQNRKAFEESLAIHLGNPKTAAAQAADLRLKVFYEAFRDAGRNILSHTNHNTQVQVYQRNLIPAHDGLFSELEKIHNENQNAILATTQNVKKISTYVTQLMIIGMLIALVIASYACFHLARSILQPIQALTRATHELGEGNLDQLVPVTTRDELGDLAESFNKMAARLRAYRETTAEKIIRLHKTMESTLATFPDPIFVLNKEGRIELMNPAAMDLAEDLDLKNELPERLQKTARKALADGESFLPNSFKEVVHFRLGGDERFYLPRILPMRNEDEDLFGVAIVLYDVTRFRLLDDAKTNLVATVSHEIRTPLTSVRMVLHLLLEKTVGVLTPKQSELIETARDDSERLLRILNDLLDLTRLEQGNSDLYKEKTSPAELVRHINDIVHDAAAARELNLVCEVDPELPLVWVDRQRIDHVFTNLLNNAIKYSPIGSRVIFSARWSDDFDVQFIVRDFGPGIPEEYQDHIFDRFYRVPGQTKTGAGLGLSIAREIVIAHGGRIGVRSWPGQGSEFYFILSGMEKEEIQLEKVF